MKSKFILGVFLQYLVLKLSTTTTTSNSNNNIIINNNKHNKHSNTSIRDSANDNNDSSNHNDITINHSNHNGNRASTKHFTTETSNQTHKSSRNGYCRIHINGPSMKPGRSILCNLPVARASTNASI